MSGLVRASFWGLDAAALSEHLRIAAQERSTAVVPFVRPMERSMALVPAGARRVLTYRGFDDFMPAFSLARERCMAVHGSRWWANPNANRWARVPAAWVRWKGRSISGASPRDVHFPLGEFWLGGVLPVGPEYAAPVSVCQFADRAPRRRVEIELELMADAAD
jgi:hypothetical protein